MPVQTYKISEIPQLIELNGDILNFELSTRVKSRENLPFYAAITTQTNIDNGIEFDYKYAEGGEFIATFSSETGNNHVYYLVLKTDAPSIVDVENTIKNLYVQNTQQATAPSDTQKDSEITDKKKFILFILLVLVGAGLYYYFMVYKKEEGKSDTAPSTQVSTEISQEQESPQYSVKSSDLLSRLNNTSVLY